MTNFARGMWHGLGTTGRIFVACFLFYFVCRLFSKN